MHSSKYYRSLGFKAGLIDNVWQLLTYLLRLCTYLPSYMPIIILSSSASVAKTSHIMMFYIISSNVLNSSKSPKSPKSLKSSKSKPFKYSLLIMRFFKSQMSLMNTTYLPTCPETPQLSKFCTNSVRTKIEIRLLIYSPLHPTCKLTFH